MLFNKMDKAEKELGEKGKKQTHLQIREKERTLDNASKMLGDMIGKMGQQGKDGKTERTEEGKGVTSRGRETRDSLYETRRDHFTADGT
ncbi:MAG: hypothetical protein IPH77_19705 [Ignavibacteria bacterium]|nr:hypothetical protein [Ignavibacteria bacterium]